MKKILLEMFVLSMITGIIPALLCGLLFKIFKVRKENNMDEFQVGDRVKVYVTSSLGEAGTECGKIIGINEYYSPDKYLIEFDDIGFISTYYSAEELELL